MLSIPYTLERTPALKITRAKISAEALFGKTQYPVAFNRRSATPNKLGMF